MKFERRIAPKNAPDFSRRRPAPSKRCLLMKTFKEIFLNRLAAEAIFQECWNNAVFRLKAVICLIGVLEKPDATFLI